MSAPHLQNVLDGPDASYTPKFDKCNPVFVFLADFFSKHCETLRITRRWVLSVSKWSTKVYMLTTIVPGQN